MGFPTIPTGSRLISAIQSDTSATRTFPTLSGLTKDAGDLIIALIFAYQTGTPPAFSTWTRGTEFLDSATGTTMAIGGAYWWSDGTETGTFTVTQAGTITGHAVMIVMSIPGAHASSAPAWGGRADGTTAAADPAAVSPSWGAEDTLWIAVGGARETSLTGNFFGMDALTRHTAPWTTATTPSNYSNPYATGCSTDAIGGMEGAVAFRQLNAASENVGPWSPDLGAAGNAALLVAVRPAAPAAAAATGSVSVAGTAAWSLPATAAGSFTLGGTAGASGAAAIVRAQAPVLAEGAGGSTTIQAVFGNDVTAGSLLVAYASGSTLAADGVTFSSTGNPGWVTRADAFEAGAQQEYAIGYCKNAPGGATTITATFAGGALTNRSLIIVEYVGADISTPVDQYTPGKSTAAVTNPTDDAMVTTADGDLIFSGLIYRDATAPASAGAGYSLVADSTGSDAIAEDMIQAGAGSIAPTFTVTGGTQPSGIMSVAFRLPGGGPTPASATGSVSLSGTTGASAAVSAASSSMSLSATAGAGSGGGTSPPSVVVYKDAYVSNVSSQTRVLTQRTVATGDVVAVVVHTGDNNYRANSLAKTAGTAVIGTITKTRDASTTLYCGNTLFTFTVTTGGTLTLTVTLASQPSGGADTVWTYVATGSDGLGVTGMSTTTASVTLAASAHSAVVLSVADWTATYGTSTTLTPAGATLDAHETDGVVDKGSPNGSQFSSRGGHWDDVAGGSVAYGVTAPTSSKYNAVGWEFLGQSGGGPTPASATGSVSLDGSAGAGINAGASGSVTLAGSAIGTLAAASSGSVAVSGTAAVGATPASGTGSVSVTGTAAWVLLAIAGSVSLAGTAAAAGRASAAGALSVSGTAAWSILAVAGSVSVSGSSAAAAAVSASGSVVLSGTAAAGATGQPSANGTVSLSGQAVAPTGAAGATGTVSLAGTSAGSAPISAGGSVTVTGSAAWRISAGIAGSVAVAAVAAWSVPSAPGAIAISGSSIGTLVASASSSVTISGTAVVVPPGTNAQGGVTITGSAAASVLASVAPGSVSIAGSTDVSGRAVAAGQVSMSGTAVGSKPATGAGSVTLLGSTVGRAELTAAGALALLGAITAKANAGAGGQFDLIGGALARAALAAAGYVTLTGTAIGLPLSAFTTRRIRVSGREPSMRGSGYESGLRAAGRRAGPLSGMEAGA